jgi:hypothetical protein
MTRGVYACGLLLLAVVVLRGYWAAQSYQYFRGPQGMYSCLKGWGIEAAFPARQQGHRPAANALKPLGLARERVRL